MLVFKKISDRRHVRLLSVLCAVVYVASYLTRVNFAAVTVAICRDNGWEKTMVSIVTTAIFISYGIGQLISGWLGDRFRPDRIMTVGLGVSILLNLMLPFCTQISQMAVIWCMNGLAQAMLWPPIVRILAGYFNQRDYQEATVIVSWGSSVGTIFVYLISSLCIAVSGWRTVFFVCAGLAFLICVAWIILFPKFSAYAEKYGTDDVAPSANADKINTTQKLRMPKILLIMLGVILLTAIILGALRDSINTWLPNFVGETFNMGSSIAILTGVVIPVLTTLIYPPVLAYYRRFFTNELACSSTIYAVSAVAALILYFVHDSSPILSVILLAFVCSCMHGANYLLIGLIPKRFDSFGNVALISGVINSSVYIGSSISIWGIAAIAEGSGWRATIAVWFFLALFGMFLCLIGIHHWGSIFEKKERKH